LIACANVGNLLLVQALDGNGKAPATDIGAGRGRLIRQALTESLLLSLFGGLVGSALGWAGTRGLTALQPAGMLRVTHVTVELAAPAVHRRHHDGERRAVRPGPRAVARAAVPRRGIEGGRAERQRGSRIRRWGNGLVVAEVSLALLLTVGAGLLLKSFWNLVRWTPGSTPRTC